MTEISNSSLRKQSNRFQEWGKRKVSVFNSVLYPRIPPYMRSCCECTEETFAGSWQGWQFSLEFRHRVLNQYCQIFMWVKHSQRTLNWKAWLEQYMTEVHLCQWQVTLDCIFYMVHYYLYFMNVSWVLEQLHSHVVLIIYICAQYNWNI